MDEELLKGGVDIYGAFDAVAETYEQAEEKAKEEQGRPKIERFETKKDGNYSIRILPIAPQYNEETKKWELDRKGFEYPVRQMFLDIELPKKGAGKPAIINIPVIRIDDPALGNRAFSADLIQTYVKVAKDKYADDDAIVKLINSNTFEHGLKWTSYRPMYVLDNKEREKGPKLFMATYSQYKSIYDARMLTWGKLLEVNSKAACPISSIKEAYSIDVIRKTENKKTTYNFQIDTLRCNPLKKEELETLMKMPSLPETLYRFTRYQLEAEIVFLQQYDKKHNLDVMSEPEIQETIDKIKGELPKDDTSHFSLDGADKDNDDKKGSSKGELTFTDLEARYNQLCDEGLGDDSDEGNELREDIRKFIEDKNLNVRVSHRKTTEDLLDDVYTAIQDMADEAPANAVKVENKSDDTYDEDEDNNEDEDEPEEKVEKAAERPTRRTRPVRSEENEETTTDEAPADNEPESEPVVPRRRRRPMRE